VTIEDISHLIDVKRTVPSRDRDAGHAVANHVRSRPRHRHEPLDAEQERLIGDRDGLHSCQGCGKPDKLEPDTPAAPLEMISMTAKIVSISCVLK